MLNRFDYIFLKNANLQRHPNMQISVSTKNNPYQKDSYTYTKVDTLLNYNNPGCHPTELKFRKSLTLYRKNPFRYLDNPLARPKQRSHTNYS